MNEEFNKDLHGVTSTTLRFNLWFVRHKIVIENIAIGIAIGLLTLLYIYNIWNAVILLVFERDSFKDLQANIARDYVNSAELRQRNTPLAIKVDGLRSVNSGENMVDIIAKITNQNEKFAATSLHYRFVSGSNQTLFEGTTFVWPKQTKYVVAFNVPSVNSNAQLVIDEMKWQRFFDFKPVLSEKQNFTLADARYIPAKGTALGRATASVTNSTIYNFYDVGFYIILLNGDEVVGAGYTNVSRFASQQVENLEVGITNRPAFVTSVQVIPEINILDPSVYYLSEPTPPVSDVLPQ